MYHKTTKKTIRNKTNKILKLAKNINMKIYKILLKTTKYSLIVFFILVLIFTIIFLNYTFKVEVNIPTSQNITIYDRDDNIVLELNNQKKQTYVTIDNISPYLKKAIISIEDKKFYKHHGIDTLRIGGALINNIKNDDLSQGASTITQQYARMIYLSNEKTYSRKIEEIMIAINLERKYTKNQILEAYLNNLYFDHGIYGIDDASEFYFNKEPIDLSLAESCILASIPKGPTIYSPIKNYEKNKERKELILKELLSDKMISSEEYNQALNEEISFHKTIQKNNSYYAPYYQDTIIEKLEELNIPKDKDLIIKTSLDLNLNNIIINSLNKYFPSNSDIQIAIVAMDPQSGEVLDIIGGANYQKSTYNRATKSLRQPGSTIKPFLYYCALENGFTPITTFYSSQTSFNIDGHVYSPKNYLNIYPNQDVTLTYALATSDNIYAMKTHLFLGTHMLYNKLKSLGFTSKIYNTPSLALGTSEVYLNELVQAYSKLASLGKDINEIYIREIIDSEGNLLYKSQINDDQILDETTCFILSEAMTNVFDNNLAININVTGSKISSLLTKKYAAKSGSTDYDNLMIGYNNKIVLGIWCGYDDNRLIYDDAKFIKFLWADIMENYLKEYSKKECWYKEPSDVISIKVNPTKGTLAYNNEYSKKIYFNVNNIPWYIFDTYKNDEEKEDFDYSFYN